MSQETFVELPLFLIVEKVTDGGRQIHNPVTLSDPNAPTAAALFTDREAAEQFRDEHATGRHVVGMDAAPQAAATLTALKQIVEWAAIDPYRLGKKTRIARLDDLIAVFSAPPPA